MSGLQRSGVHGCGEENSYYALTIKLLLLGNSRAALRVARWSACLKEFDYGVQYRPGSLNSVADCLSRLPLANTEHDFAEIIESVAMISFASSAISKEDFQSACNNWPKHKKDVDAELQGYIPK